MADEPIYVNAFGPADLLQEIELNYEQAHPHASDATMTLHTADGDVLQVVLTAHALVELERFLGAVRETFPEVLELRRDAPESN